MIWFFTYNIVLKQHYNNRVLCIEIQQKIEKVFNHYSITEWLLQLRNKYTIKRMVRFFFNSKKRYFNWLIYSFFLLKQFIFQVQRLHYKKNCEL